MRLFVAALGDISAGTPVKDGGRGGRRIGRVSVARAAAGGGWVDCRTHRDQRERVFETLSYFDGVAFARPGAAPPLDAVGMMDLSCPTSNVYAASKA